jgi:hypothetical protein
MHMQHHPPLAGAVAPRPSGEIVNPRFLPSLKLLSDPRPSHACPQLAGESALRSRSELGNVLLV